MSETNLKYSDDSKISPDINASSVFMSDNTTLENFYNIYHKDILYYNSPASDTTFVPQNITLVSNKPLHCVDIIFFACNLQGRRYSQVQRVYVNGGQTTMMNGCYYNVDYMTSYARRVTSSHISGSNNLNLQFYDAYIYNSSMSVPKVNNAYAIPRYIISVNHL